MNKYRSKICWFLGGVVAGGGVTIAVALLMYLYVIPDWLVVQATPVSADAAVVLGGGGPLRLGKAIALYDSAVVRELILVDVTERKWTSIIDKLGSGYEIRGKNHTIISGSLTTETDAQLSLQECKRKGIKSIVAITDPYHSRRVSITFGRVYAGSGIRVTTINSGDYNGMIPPQGKWRQHRATRDLVWLETGKTMGGLFPAFFRRMFMREDTAS